MNASRPTYLLVLLGVAQSKSVSPVLVIGKLRREFAALKTKNRSPPKTAHEKENHRADYIKQGRAFFGNILRPIASIDRTGIKPVSLFWKWSCRCMGSVPATCRKTNHCLSWKDPRPIIAARWTNHRNKQPLAVLKVGWEGLRCKGEGAAVAGCPVLAGLEQVWAILQAEKIIGVSGVG